MAALPFLASREDPDEALRFVWDAFWNLTTDRPVGFATGPIPWTAVDRYAARHRIDGADAFERFLAVIRAMDGAYLDHLEREREKARKDNPANGQS
jgi:hypothetical protein